MSHSQHGAQSLTSCSCRICMADPVRVLVSYNSSGRWYWKIPLWTMNVFRLWIVGGDRDLSCKTGVILVSYSECCVGLTSWEIDCFAI